ncbi:MAG: acetylglutamate kinase [Flavobacteriales bacterium]|nr:acetylglutamate kinase [Flavobacteriales bacterium]
MKTKLKIIKIGGNIIDDPDQLNQFLIRFSTLKGQKILVHGGGKTASDFSKKLGIKPHLINGRRITHKEDLEIVTMVYAGLINKKITAILQREGCNAIGLSGVDANCIQSVKRPVESIDYGCVGNVKSVESLTIDLLLTQNIVPVFSAITHDGAGNLLNTNADTIASEIAIAMNNIYDTELIYCFEKSGVLQPHENEEVVIERMDQRLFHQMKSENTIYGGMIPKIENCFHALKNNVQKVSIGNAYHLTEPGQVATTIHLS